MLTTAKREVRVVPDRLGEAWEAFQSLSAGQRREFLNLLRDWNLRRCIAAVAARGGGTYSHRPPLAGLSVGDALDRDDADDLRNIRW
jgi:hypothetical protein